VLLKELYQPSRPFLGLSANTSPSHFNSGCPSAGKRCSPRQGKCSTLPKTAACRKAGSWTMHTGHASCVSSWCTGGATNSLCHPLGRTGVAQPAEIQGAVAHAVGTPSRAWKQRQRQLYKRLSWLNTLDKISSACDLYQALSRVGSQRS